MNEANAAMWLKTDLEQWARLDLPAYRHRDKHPMLSRAIRVLGWINQHYQLTRWTDLRPSMIQAFIQAHPDLEAATHHSYVKAIRRWLRWHERDDFDAPVISARLQGICPKTTTDEPFVVDEDTWRHLLHRARWVFKGSTAVRCTQGKRDRIAFMGHWRPGGFYLWLTLGSELGLRPWELAFLHRDEIHLDVKPAHIRLIDHTARARKTPLAGTPLKLSPCVQRELADYMAANPGPMVFAVPSATTPSGWEPPNYDQVWAAFRAEFGLPNLNGRVVRRRHATRLASTQPNVFDAIKATRHARLDTLRHYLQRHGGHVIDPATGKAVEQAEA
jgi:hypothetical protein